MKAISTQSRHTSTQHNIDILPPSAWRLPLMRQGWGFLLSYAANRTVSSAGSCFIEAGSVLAFRPSPELTSLQANTRCPRALPAAAVQVRVRHGVTLGLRRPPPPTRDLRSTPIRD